MREEVRTLLAAALGVAGAFSSPALARPPVDSAKPAPAPMAWEERRAGYFQLLRDVQAGDPNSQKVFDAVLKDFEAHPTARTPMENMDILGTAFAAKKPPGDLLVSVAMNAALGWYDALRYGSPSGRDEIVAQERFFVRAFSMAGAEVQQRAVAFLQGPPEQVSASVRAGLRLAGELRDTDRYDHTWPAAYGRERLAGSPAPSLPSAQWPEAWQAALAKVRAFYVIKPAAEPDAVMLAPGAQSGPNSGVQPSGSH